MCNKLEYSLKCYTSCIESESHSVLAATNLALFYRSIGDIDEATKYMEKVLKFHHHPTKAFVASIFLSAGFCDWSTRNKDLKDLAQIVEAELMKNVLNVSAQPFHSIFVPQFTPAICLGLSRAFARRAKFNTLLRDVKSFIHLPQRPSGKLRVGYVSSSFGVHPTGILTQGVYRLHDRSKFEVFCYSLSCTDNSSIWDRVCKDADHFIDISEIESHVAAKMINADGIQILVNLDGYVNGSRNEIFAYNPAPVQILMMGGHCGTMGAKYIHYIVADSTLIPEDQTRNFSEKIIHVPHIINDYKNTASFMLEDAPDSMQLRAKYGISDDAFVYACFSQPYKIDPQIFCVWMNILNEVRGSVLLLLRYNSEAETNLRKEAAKYGINPEKIIFLDIAPFHEHIQRYRIADLFLDTAVCSGTATGCEILWSGSPMVSLIGDRMCNRIGASLLMSVGLEELIVDNLEDYKRIAVSLNTDEERFIDIIRRLDESRSTYKLFDSEKWVKTFESAIEKAFNHFVQGKEPENIFA